MKILLMSFIYSASFGVGSMFWSIFCTGLGFWIIFMFVWMRDEYGIDRDGCMKEPMGWLSEVVLRRRWTVFESGKATETIAENRRSKY